MKKWRNNWELKLTALLLAAFLWLALRLNTGVSLPLSWPGTVKEETR